MKNLFYNQMNTGFETLRSEGEAAELRKQGVMRGGNSGCMLEDGRILGSDPRKALLRFAGIQTRTDFDTNLTFQAGHNNEDGVDELLSASGVPFLRETECPTSWTLPSPTLGEETSYQVTGRPDVVVCQAGRDSSVPHYGVELKLISSPGTLMHVGSFAGNQPKDDAACQSAHYSWQHNLPWVIAYISRSYYMMAPYGPKRLETETHTMDEPHRSIMHNNGRPFMFKPSCTLFNAEWKSPELFTVDEKPTLITQAGIIEYYSYIAQCWETKTVPESRGVGSFDLFGVPIQMKNNKIQKYYDYEEARTDSWDNWIADCIEISRR